MCRQEDLGRRRVKGSTHILTKGVCMLIITQTEEQKMLVKMVQDFARDEIANEVERMEEQDRFPEEIIKKMGSSA